MHHKLRRFTVRTAVIGAVVVLGSTAAAQGAMAGPAPSGIVSVACNTPALISAVAGASYGQKLQLSFGCTYRLTAALPDIDTSLTIVGMGATLERSEDVGTPEFTILTVDAGDVNLVEVNFRNGGGTDNNDGEGGAIYNDGGHITVLGGTFTGNDVDEAGGAIYNDGTLTMTSAYFIDSGAYFGGAIENDGTMTLRSSHFANYGAQTGGAIDNTGFATIIGTTFTNGSTLAGGALANFGQVALSYVTIQDSYAGYFGGGIYNDGTLTLASSRIVRNSTGGEGGGIENFGTLTAASSSIVGNHAEVVGGGIFNDIDGTVTLSLTKVYGNTPGNCFPTGTIAGCSG
jgi:hypothetical protein